MFNLRFTHITDSLGNDKIVNALYSSKPVFTDDSDLSPALPACRGLPDNNPTDEKILLNKERAQRRARKAVSDIIIANPELDFFFTGTFADSDLRYNHDLACKKCLTWLNNNVSRNGLSYVFIPELHKDGALHFHGAINSALPMVDSGTVIAKGHKKPIKVSTADKLKIPLDDRKTVYNIPSWKFGFTTAIQLYGERRQAINYITKYITKTFNKIGGRYYYSGGVTKPTYTYHFSSICDVDFEALGAKNIYRFYAAGIEFISVDF